jgi:serine/threonine-protein kinase
MLTQIGRYQVLGELGRGGMGAVLLGYDPTLQRQVAIKQVRPDGGTDAELHTWLEKRLFREAQAAARLRHPGIVAVHDLLEEAGTGYIIMEYVAGRPLSAMLTPGQPADPDFALRVLQQTAAALDHAHGAGVVHCDIKPANIMIDETGTARITDFGIAKVAGSATQTTASITPGTLDYMAPERVCCQAVDGRADQYALAVVAYQLFTGARIYSADTVRSLVLQIAATMPQPASRTNPSLPAAVDSVLTRGLAKTPEGRYATCGEFVAALDAAFRAPTVAAPTPGVHSVPSFAAAAPARETAPSNRRTKNAILGIAALAGVIGGIAVYHATNRPVDAPVAGSVAERPLPIEAPKVEPPAATPAPRSDLHASSVVKEVPKQPASEAKKSRVTEASAAPKKEGVPAAPNKGEVPVEVARTTAPNVSQQLQQPVPPRPSPTPLPPTRILVGGTVQGAKLISQPQPVYPQLAKQARVQGVVELSAVISRDGTITELKVVSGHPLLVDAAVAAVKQWTYQPTMLNGEPVEVLTTIEVNFTLSQ